MLGVERQESIGLAADVISDNLVTALTETGTAWSK